MATLVLFIALLVCAQAQLDLPPLPTPAAVDLFRATPAPAKSAFNEVADAAVVDNDDDDDESHNGARASHYDRDRSERFGPPYSLDNIARSPPLPSSAAGGLLDNQAGGGSLSDTHRNSDYPGTNVPYQQQQPHNNYQQSYANNGGGDRYSEGRPRSNGDDYRFYRDPDSDRYGNDDQRGRSRPAYGDDDKYYRSGQQQPYNNNNNNAYPGYGNTGNTGGGGGGGYGFARGPALDSGGHRDTSGGYGYGNDDAFNRNRDQPYNTNNNNNRPLFEDDRNRYEQNRLNELEVAKLKQLLAKVDRQSSVECALNVRAQWDFETNVNEITQIQAVCVR